jgi:hypothetical protein
MTIATEGLGSYLDSLATGDVPNAIFQTVETIAELQTVPHGTEGQLVYCRTTQCYYALGKDDSWQFVTSATSLASQPTWYVDPTGDDTRDGKTLGTALATTDELMRRLWPGGRRQDLTQDVTIYINTANPTTFTYPQLLMNVGTSEPLAAGLAFFVLNVICGKVSSAPITLNANAVIPIATINQRGQLSTASGTFLDEELIEITSGPGIGGVGYCTGLNGDAQHCFIGGMSVPTIAGSLVNGGHGQDIKPLAGDTCVVTQLVTQITRLEIECSGFARVFVQYGKFVRVSISGSTLSTAYAGIGGPVYISCSQQVSAGGRWENTCGGANLFQCRTPRGKKTSLLGTGWCIIDHCVQGILGLSGYAITYGLTIDGGQIRVGISDDYNHPAQSVNSRWLLWSSYTNLFSGGSSGSIEFCRGNLTSGGGIGYGSAILVCEGSEINNVDFNGYLWGGSTPFDYGIVVMANAHAVQGNIAPGVFAQCWKIPSTTNIVVDNLYFSFSDNPIQLGNGNSGLIGSNYNVDNNYNLTDSGFYKKLQNANVSPTAFYQIRQSGMYKVRGYVAVTTADAAATGTPVLNVTWTDDSGVAQTKAVATGPALTTLGGNGGEVIIECGPNNALATWSITGVGSVGNAKFSVRMRVEKDCYGA